MVSAGPAEYARLWLRQALSRTWNIGDTVSGIVGVLAAVAAHYSPTLGQKMTGSLWQVPIYALAATALFRFVIFAPYELWKKERDGSAILQGQLADLSQERPFRQTSTRFLFNEDGKGGLTNTLTDVELHHENTGEPPVRYTLDSAFIEVNGQRHDLERFGPTAIVQGESSGRHRCHLITPMDLAMPIWVRVSYDYRYDTIPPVLERTTGATMRFCISHPSTDGPYFDDQREG